jgi:CheY-like chemotaxis protein
MNHPALTLGYRLEADGAVLVYATDHEPHSLHPLAAAPGTPPIHHEDRRHVRFLEGADLIIHDAQYTLDEFPDKIGWGHSPVERVVDYAVLARAKRLALFHHDPDRDDAEVDHLVAVANERAAGGDHVPVVLGAAEGQEIELQGDAHSERVPIDDDTTALLPAGPRRKHTVLLVDSDPEALTSLERALRSEGVDVLTASDGASALGIARKSRPSLLLVDLELRLLDGLDLCRVLRSDSDPRLRDVPILVMTASDLKETDLIDAFMAGAYDYLTKPIKDTLVRSRVRGWLMRATR